MVKWKIGLGIYCALVLYISSMSPGELPKTGVAISDKAIHLVEYAIMGILAWGAFGKGGAGCSPTDAPIPEFPNTQIPQYPSTPIP